MPIIDSQSSPTPVAEFAGEAGIDASLTVPVLLDAVFDGNSDITPTLSGGFYIETLAGNSDLSATLAIPTNLSATFDGDSDMAALVLSVEFPESWSLDLIIDIVPSLLPDREIRYIPRFRADGVDIPITDWSYSESQQIAGGDCQVTLARPSDRSLFGVNTVIDFGFGFLTAPGVFDNSTMDWKILGGTFTGLQMPIGWANNAPTDKVIVNGSSSIYDKLNVTAERGIIFYDTAVEEVTTDEIEPIVDENGVSYLPELVGISGLTLYDVLDRVLITECGFTSYEAPPDYPLRRVDCPMGQSLWSSVSGFLGMYQTEVVVELDVLKIIDTTLVSPSGFPVPKQVGVSNYQQLGLTDQPRNIDGLIVNISENKRNYDFVTQRFENKTTYAGSLSTTTESEFREYRRFAHPFVVIKDELAKITKSTFGLAGTVSDIVETFTYNSRDLESGRTKTVRSLLPDLNTGVPSLQDENVETEESLYAAHPFKTRATYLQQHQLTITGAAIKDTQNQQIGKDFYQPYSVSARSGNLQTGQTLVTDFLLSIKRETYEPLRGNKVRVTEFEFDGTPNEGTGQVIKDETKTVPGDVALNDISPHPTQIIVFAEDNHTRSKERLESVNFGELPIELALPLARRMIKRAKEKSRNMNLTVAGYDPLLLKGFVIDALDAGVPVRTSGVTLGNFLILSLNISGNAVEFNSSATGIQV